jgi:CMP-N-acetylneuraminic acid synthetase
MMEMKIEKIAALLPMRHHSERIPGKNYRLLAGKPLFHHVLHTMQDVPEINQIVVDTDSPVIIQSLRRDFPNVIILERPNTCERIRFR